MTPSQPSPKSCHNCRRQRLKCDRSVPQCLKCVSKGQECLGYQRLFRWERGIASRGKLVGKTFGDLNEDRSGYENSSSQSSSPASLVNQRFFLGTGVFLPSEALTDPLLQDLNHATREYLFYFAFAVCKDLVLYDTPQHNPFRELIPLTQQHPVLLQVIIASSALRMSNASQKILALDIKIPDLDYRYSPPRSPCSGSLVNQRSKSYSHALTAKQRALHLLRPALSNIESADFDVILAVVLLFIDFELIDSGRDNWMYHVHGAKKLIKMLCESQLSTDTTMSSLRSCLISNCLVFDILGSTLASPPSLISKDLHLTGTLSLLQDSEGNHCSSFPIVLLQLVQAGAQLSSEKANTQVFFPPQSGLKHQQITALLQSAQSFDAVAWAMGLQPHSPTPDYEGRMHIASAHRAAVCIYLSRILLSIFPNTELSHDLASLVTQIVHHLSSIYPKNALFKAIAWPAFIAGAETKDRTTQVWVAMRFQELWEVEPWGLIRGALGVLQDIWTKRRKSEGDEENEESSSDKMNWTRRDKGDWIGHLKEGGVNWLII